MQRDFLGDALDFWKGDLLSRLEAGRVANDVHVLPMLTDAPWVQPELDTYASLLRRRTEQIILAQVRFGTGSRSSYSSDANRVWAGDIFVDPDIGVHDAGGSECVRLDELRVLLDPGKLAATDRLLIVHQHRGQRQTRDAAIESWQKRIAPLGVPTCILSCEQVGLFFVSRAESRIAELRRFLEKMLGPTARSRVI